MATLRAALFLAVVFTAAVALAQNGTGVDAQENLFGATNINATIGHGGLTAGISEEGDVTVLSWPNPSYNDQLGYISSNDLDARDQPRFGAAEGAGVVAGLRCLIGGEAVVTWLRDDSSWTRSQNYGPDDGPNAHTRYERVDWGMSIEVVDAIHPVADVFVRTVSATRASDGPVESCSLLSHVNLSPQPSNSRIAELPIADWATDGRNDFAAIWDEAASASVHFHPDDRRLYDEVTDLLNPTPPGYGSIGEALARDSLTAEELDALLDGAAEEYGAGAWAMATTVPAPSQHQIGFDDTPFCDNIDRLIDNIVALPETFPDLTLPLDPSMLELLRCSGTAADEREMSGWSYSAGDAWSDLGDGELSGASLAAGEVSTALVTPLEFDGSSAVASLVIGLGTTLDAARAAVEAATADPAAVARESRRAVEAWLDGQTIPGDEGSRVYDVARRALLNLRVGTDRDTGAVVASIARQPPYALDWPRDGAFFNIAFDAAGQAALVDRRIQRYVEWQRVAPAPQTPILDPPPPRDPRTGRSATYPADAWEMNYYADGMVGGVFRFEIDSTAFAVWTIVAHAGWVEDPEGYLASVWDAIERGATLLAEWRDPETGLHAPAQEDDQATYKQTLHGAITVFGALDITSRAARLLGRVAAAERWEARATELRDAIERHFYSEVEQAFFMAESDRVPLRASGLEATGPTAWLVWPMSLYTLDHPAIIRQLTRDAALVEPAIELRSVGGLYYMKNTVSLAVAGHGAFDELIARWPELLAEQATPGTDHFGEVMVVDATRDEPVAEQRVSTPHLWEGSLFYLTALAAENPQALRRYDDVLPASRVRSGGDVADPEGDAGVSPDAGPGGDTELSGGGGGGGCSIGGSISVGGWIRLALVCAVLALRRRPPTTPRSRQTQSPARSRGRTQEGTVPMRQDPHRS